MSLKPPPYLNDPDGTVWRRLLEATKQSDSDARERMTAARTADPVEHALLRFGGNPNPGNTFFDETRQAREDAFHAAAHRFS